MATSGGVCIHRPESIYGAWRVHRLCHPARRDSDAGDNGSLCRCTAAQTCNWRRAWPVYTASDCDECVREVPDEATPAACLKDKTPYRRAVSLVERKARARPTACPGPERKFDRTPRNRSSVVTSREEARRTSLLRLVWESGSALPPIFWRVDSSVRQHSSL
ncbi:hypothetical protein MRX96_029228 [Rhipicephalus microplus]